MSNLPCVAVVGLTCHVPTAHWYGCIVFYAAVYEQFIEKLDQITDHDFQFLAALPTEPAPSSKDPGPYKSVVHIPTDAELEKERMETVAAEKLRRKLQALERLVG